MSSTPRVNERQLAQHLRDPDAADPDLLRYFISLSLLAAHDRKVTHGYMVEVINLAAKLHCSLTYFKAAAATRHMLLRLEHTPDKIDEQAKPAMKEYIKLREELADKVELLAECAGPDDIVS